MKRKLFTGLLFLICVSSLTLAQQNWEWKKINPLNCTRHSQVVVNLDGEKIMVIGGAGESPTGVSAASTAEILDSVNGSWRLTEPMVLSCDGGHKAVKLDNNKILVVSGYATTCELFDPITEKWSLAASAILNHRQLFTLTKLNDGRVLLIGGIKDINAVDRVVYWNQCEIYNPVTNKWKLTDSLVTARAWHSTVLLKDNRVLVAGGLNKGDFLKSCEIFDPVTEKWTSFADMNDVRYNFTLFTKEDGTVIASGTSVEVFENGAKNWSKKANLFIPRSGYTPVIRSNGNVLYCGGNGSVRPVTYEEYDLSKYAPVFVNNFADIIFDAAFVPVKGDRIVQTGGNTSIEYMGELYIYNSSACYVYTSEITPVELTTFTGSFVDSKVMLNWATATATETNNRGFEIERKTAAGVFEKIGYTAGAGTTTIPQKYKFTDDKFISGINTYRLKQMDFDGKYEYSKTIEINTSAPQSYALMQNYPNPFNPSTTIKYQIAKAGLVTIKVFNILGQEVSTLINDVQNQGMHEVVFDGTKLTSGMYIYSIKTNEFTSSKKMILIK